MTPLVSLRQVRVGEGAALRLDIPSLDIVRGETLVVLGPTGAGKSTLLRVLNGLLEPAAGMICWDGAPVVGAMTLELRRRMVMAFQDPLLFRGTVADNVAWGLRLRGIRGQELSSRVARALEMFSIGHLRDRSSARLSGGEAHRVSLARAVVLRPELLLLDEPLASVDAVTRERLGAELRTVLREERTTCVYVTHDQREAQRMADRVAVIDGGMLLQAGTPEEVFYRPASERVARFVQAGNMLEGTVRRVREGLAELELGAL